MSQISSHQAGAGRPPRGAVVPCAPCRGETKRHRVISADGHDLMVTTVTTSSGFMTGAYPIQYGYQVMICQPICEQRLPDEAAASEEHDALVRALADAGVSVVRARRKLAARSRAERADAAREISAERSRRVRVITAVAAAL
jgi:hypothetical protein